MEREQILFTAGQFARLHRLNKRTLHYYDDIGLFSPARKGENGYRYYTYSQSVELENILALRELGMSVEALRAYLDRPDADRFLSMSEEKIGEIDRTVRHLQRLKAVLRRKQELLRLSQSVRAGQIDLVDCPAEALYITPMGPGDVETGALLEHLQAAWDLSAYKIGCGSMISMDRVRQGAFDAYDGWFTPVEHPGRAKGLFRKPAGTYLRGFCVGDWDKLPGLYSAMMAAARDRGLALTGYAYELGLNEFAISGAEEYVTQVTILTE